MAKTEIVRLAPAAGRATGVASALATGADVIAIEDPLTGLADEAADAWGRVLAAALADHISLIFAPRMALASALARAADEAIVATASRIDGQGSPVELASAPRRFVARFDGPVASIAQVLAERGARVETRDHPLSHHLSIDLGTELSTHELIDICDRAGLAVVELVPAFRALT